MPTAQLVPDRFSVGNSIEGYEVNDHDGRPVTSPFPIRALAADMVANLNSAAAASPLALAVALGAADQFELEADVL